MKHFLAGVALMVAVGASGCHKKAEPPPPPPPPPPAAVLLVPESERSPHFETVAKHLELGGTVFGYMDLDGDALKLADNLSLVVNQVAAANPMVADQVKKLDFRVLVTELGLTDIKAIGLSSVPTAGGSFRNREFLYTPDGRHGLLAVYGGAPAAFTRTRLAPADADYYCESEINLAAVYDTIKNVAVKMGHPEVAAGFDTGLKGAGLKVGFSILDAIGALKGRITVIARVDPDKTIAIGKGAQRLVLPSYSIVVCVDGVGPVVDAALAKSPAFSLSTNGTRHFYTPKGMIPFEGLNAVLAVDGSSFYAATSPDFLRECLDRTAGLDQNPDFSRMLADLGPEGNGLTYFTPRFFSGFQKLGELNAAGFPQLKAMFGALAKFPAPSRPMMRIRENLPDGILVRDSFNRSLKRELAAIAIYNPVTVGLMAGIIAQQAQLKARTQPSFGQGFPPPSADRLIQANLHTLWVASIRYYKDHNTLTATFDDLVGPGKYVPRIQVWEGENYRLLRFQKGRMLRLILPDGRVLTYPPRSVRPPSSPRLEPEPSPQPKNPL